MNKEGRIGHIVTTVAGGEKVRAYVPKPLPPAPPLVMEGLYGLLDDANRALGRLDGMSTILPDPSLFLYMYIRKEALLSSQIEGTQSSLSDLLLLESEEASGVTLDDVTEVSNYVAAMTHGLKRLREGMPVSLRLIREIHEILLSSGRGAGKQPGVFRTSQNWIGGSRPGNALFVPPPPQDVMPCLGDLEKFIHDEDCKLPALVKAGLVHLQFETIHPFLDGNGRVGRLLITFLLCANKMMAEPILYLSLYFKKNRQTYYDLLQEVRLKGTWETWLEFFLTGVRETSDQATEAAARILKIFQEDRRRIEKLGRAASSCLRVHDYIQKRPITNLRHLATETGKTIPTVTKAVHHLTDLGIVREITGHARNRIFTYGAYMKILEQGTEPL